MPRSGRGGPLLGDLLAVWDGIRSALPYLEDEVTVTVHGSPKANRRQLYFLAAACGFSLVRRYDIFPGLGPPPGVIMLEWDAASNTVRFLLKYKTSIASSSVGDAENTLGKLYLFNGPPEEVRGESWNYTGVLAGPGVDALGPLSGLVSLVPGAKKMLGINPKIPAPVLPFAGRPILTRNPTCDDPLGGGATVHSPNPRPAGDGRSRGSAYQMIYSAITTPQGGGLKEFPAAPAGTEFTGG